MAGRLELPEIHATSPTMTEIMRLCFLRAGLSQTSGSSSFILGSPKSWLGNAYHEVLEKLPCVDLEKETFDAAIDRLWDEAITSQYQRARNHPLDRRFGPPTTWPGYHMARAGVRMRALEVSTTSAPTPVNAPSSAAISVGTPAAIREQTFAAFGGRIVGRPDVISLDEILDYKSGGIMEDDEGAHTELVKAAYVRQLRIYGYLVKETLGWWPKRGLILPLAGPGAKVDLEPAECERETSEAIELLESYNMHIRAKMPPVEMAAPSPSACKWCQYKLVCPAFWQSASPAWSGQLAGASVEGIVPEPPRPIHNGKAIAFAVNVQAGSEARGPAEIAPVDPAIHDTASVLASGDHIRLIDLRIGSSGVLIPTQRTVLARVSEVPEVSVTPTE